MKKKVRHSDDIGENLILRILLDAQYKERLETTFREMCPTYVYISSFLLYKCHHSKLRFITQSLDSSVAL